MGPGPMTDDQRRRWAAIVGFVPLTQMQPVRSAQLGRRARVLPCGDEVFMPRILPAFAAIVSCLFPLLAADQATAEPVAVVQPAAGDTDQQLLIAARLADDVYQRHYQGLLGGLESPDEALRVRTIRDLGRLQDGDAIPFLLPFLEASKRSPAELNAAAESVADLGAAVASEPLQRLLSHRDASVRAVAQKSMTRLKTMGPGHFMGRAKDRDDALRSSAITNLGTLKHSEAAAVLIQALGHDDRTHIRRMAALSLAKLGDRAHAPALIEALTDGDARVRRYAATGLAQLGAVEAVPALLMALEANIAGVHINRAVMQLTGQDFGFDASGNILERTAAIESGFAWWAANAKAALSK